MRLNVGKVCRTNIIICVLFAFFTNRFVSLNRTERANRRQSSTKGDQVHKEVYV